MGYNEKPKIGGLVKRILDDAERESLREESQGFSDVPWSLGRLSDLLWRHSPRSRSVITRHVINLFDAAIHFNELPQAILPSSLLEEYWREVLRPILLSGIDDAEDLRNELNAIHSIITFSNQDDEGFLASQVREVIVSRLAQEPYYSLASPLVPELFEILPE